MAELAVNALPDPLSMPVVPSLDELRELADYALAALSKRHIPFPVNPIPEEWTVDKIREARKRHDQGFFWDTMRLIRIVTTDPRVASALSQRVDTPTGLPIKARPCKLRNGAGVGETARAECEDMFSIRSYSCPPTTRRALLRDQVMAGVAIGQNVWTPRADGERWDVRLERWPLEYAQWNSTLNRYQVFTREGLLTIEHGHGKWVIFEPHGPQSWLHGAIRALSMPWIDRTYGIRYRSQHAAAHGSPVPVGVMPQGVPINGPEGKLFHRFITSLLSIRIGAVRPFGSAIEYLEPKTQAWQVFDSIVKNSNEDIALALLGQDGTVTKAGVYTAPAFDGIRFDLAELDTQTFEVGAQTGMIRPWCAVNFGTEYEPTIETVLPDPEEDARRAEVAKLYPAFGQALGFLRDNGGIEITDELVSALAKEYGVPPEVAAVLKLAPKPDPVAAPALPGAPPADGQEPEGDEPPADGQPVSGQRPIAA